MTPASTKRILTLCLSIAVLALAGCSTPKSAEQGAGDQAQAGSQPAESTQDEATQDEATQDESTQPEQVPPEEEVGTAKAGIAQAEHEAQAALELPHMAEPFEGIITAGQPSPAQYEKLPDAGVHTVINLRGADEKGAWDEKSKAEALGLEYVNIPIESPQDLTRKKVDLFSDVLRKEKGKFLVHCGSSNRVGAMFALRAFWIEHKSPDEAIEIGKKAGLDSLEGAVREKMAKWGGVVEP